MKTKVKPFIFTDTRTKTFLLHYGKLLIHFDALKTIDIRYGRLRFLKNAYGSRAGYGFNHFIWFKKTDYNPLERGALT